MATAIPKFVQDRVGFAEAGELGIKHEGHQSNNLLLVGTHSKVRADAQIDEPATESRRA